MNIYKTLTLYIILDGSTQLISSLNLKNKNLMITIVVIGNRMSGVKRANWRQRVQTISLIICFITVI